MRDSIPKLTIIFFPVLSFCMISCGVTLPLQEISTAKQEITRAKLFNSEKYAKADFDNSRTNLLLAHENAFSSKSDPKKIAQLSQTSTEKARDAINKSLPNYVKDLQKEVEIAIESANIALAETLAPDIYEHATLLKAEGDELVKNADSKLANLPKDDSKAIAYDEYEKAIKRYRESIAESEKAKDLSLAQTQAIIDSSTDIESNLDLIEKYSGENKKTKAKISTLRDEYKSSIELMEKGSLRDGFKNLEKIRANSNDLMTLVILPYAKERIKTATLKIEDADKFLNSNSENAKSSVASDNLTASKEAFTSSVDLLAKERYYDSIQQSDESIRLAEDVLKRQEESDTDLSVKNRSQKEKTEKCADSKCKGSCEKEEKEECLDDKCKKSCESKTTSKETTKPTDKELKKPDSIKSPSKSAKLTPNKIKWQKHIVQKKIPPETLWRIAADKKYMGDKNLWREIYKANKKIKNPNLIYPNQVILVPINQEKLKDSNKSKK